jgi:uncharacterized protein YbjT (DUF2867 family)
MDVDRIIAVTGATGRQGGAVARHLLNDGWKVRALTREPNSEPARRLAVLGAEIVAVDMMSPDTLAPAFKDTHGVFSVQNPMISGLEAEVRQGKNVADVAKSAGVRHLVYGSAGTGVPGTGVGSWDSKVAVEGHLRERGLPLTVLRPNAFMELMTDKAFYPSVSTWHVMPKLMGADRPVTWISVDDLGAIAARVFGDPESYVGKELRLASDLRSIAECREIWRKATGHAPRQFPMPIWMFERFVGPDLTTMWRWLRHSDVPVDPADTYRLLPTASTVEQWLTRRQAAERGDRRGHPTRS